MNWDCVECPLCNKSFAEASQDRRSKTINDIELVLQDIEVEVADDSVAPESDSSLR